MLRERCKMLFGLLCRESISLDSPRNWAHFAKVEFSQSVYCQFPALTSQTHVRSRSAAREENKKVLHIAPMDTKKWDWNTPSERGRKEIRLLEAKYKIRTEEERFLPTAQQQQPALKSIGPRREWSHRNSLRPILSRGRERERERETRARTLCCCVFSPPPPPTAMDWELRAAGATVSSSSRAGGKTWTEEEAVGFWLYMQKTDWLQAQSL